MVNRDYNPLLDPAPKEIPLDNAPLARVVAQMRFPLITSIERADFIAPFQEALRKSYPILRADRTQGILFGPEGAVPTEQEIVWRFLDPTENWRISLAPDFVAVETTKYQSRSDLLDRWRVVLDALGKHVEPSFVDRIGLRYVDRVTGEDFNKLSAFIRPEILGILQHPLSSLANHSLSETAFQIPSYDAILSTRWGRIPSHSSVDPAVIEPIEEPSWILDLDMFSNKKRAFEPEILLHLTGDFAQRLYAFFRWVVTNEFLQHYGGTV